MTKRVLLAVDLDFPSPRAASHAVHLAARLNYALILMGIAPVSGKKKKKSDFFLKDLPEAQRQWLAQVVEQGRFEGVNPEIFLSSGPFFEEILSFAPTQPAIQFIVMGLPEKDLKPYRSAVLSGLDRLQKLFEGEVFIVPEKGKVMRLAEYFHLHHQGKGT